MARTRAFNTVNTAPTRSGVFGNAGGRIDKASPGLQQSRQAVAGRTGGGFRAPAPRTNTTMDRNKRRQLFARRVGTNVNSRRNRPVASAPVAQRLPQQAVPRAQPFTRSIY